MSNTFDVAAFNAAFKADLRKLTDEAGANFKAASARAASADDVDTRGIEVGDFCVLWPKINRFLNMAIGAFELFYPTKAPLLKAFVSAFKQFALPILCPVTPPAP